MVLTRLFHLFVYYICAQLWVQERTFQMAGKKIPEKKAKPVKTEKPKKTKKAKKK